MHTVDLVPRDVGYRGTSGRLKRGQKDSLHMKVLHKVDINMSKSIISLQRVRSTINIVISVRSQRVKVESSV